MTSKLHQQSVINKTIERMTGKIMPPVYAHNAVRMYGEWIRIHDFHAFFNDRAGLSGRYCGTISFSFEIDRLMKSLLERERILTHDHETKMQHISHMYLSQRMVAVRYQDELKWREIVSANNRRTRFDRRNDEDSFTFYVTTLIECRLTFEPEEFTYIRTKVRQDF